MDKKIVSEGKVVTVTLEEDPEDGVELVKKIQQELMIDEDDPKYQSERIGRLLMLLHHNLQEIKISNEDTREILGMSNKDLLERAKSSTRKDVLERASFYKLLSDILAFITK